MHPMRLLLADDNPTILNSLVNMLQGNFVVAGTFTDGSSVLNQFLRLTPDIIILDISMGEQNGIELATRLRDSGSRSKIVFLTIHDDRDFLNAAIGAGGSAYVVKAHLSAELVPAIDAALHDKLFLSASLLQKPH